MGKQKYQDALENATEAIEMGPPEQYIFKRRATALFHLARYDEVLADLRTSIEMNPDDTGTLVWIGAEVLANCPDEAFKRGLLRLADQLIETTHHKVGAHIQRAKLHYAMDHVDEGEADLTKAIELNPKSKFFSWPLEHRGVMCSRLDRWDEATTDFERATQVAPESWEPRYHLALAQLAMQDTVGYGNTCQAMIDTFSETEDPLLANFVAWTCSLGPNALKDWSPALKLARMAAARPVDSLQIQNTLGTLMMRAGQTDEAIKVLSSVAEQLDKPNASVNSSPACTWYALALAYDDAGQPEQARQWRDKADARTSQVLDDPSASAAAAVAWNRRFELLRGEVKTRFDTKTESTTKQGK